MSKCSGAGTRSQSDCRKERCGNICGYDALFWRNERPVISLFKFPSKSSVTQTILLTTLCKHCRQSLPWTHTEGILRNLGRAPRILNPRTVWWWLVSSTYRWLYFRRKILLYSEAGWAAESVWRLCKVEHFMSTSEVLNKAMPCLFVIKRYTEGLGGVVSHYLPRHQKDIICQIHFSASLLVLPEIKTRIQLCEPLNSSACVDAVTESNSCLYWQSQSCRPACILVTYCLIHIGSSVLPQ
jgi:hypothetical protein